MNKRSAGAVHRGAPFCLHQGAYRAPRAAALAGMPVSTLHHWARNGVVVPSISPVREKLWSYADVMGLRIVVWLRRKKLIGKQEVPRTSMSVVRLALQDLEARGEHLWAPTGSGRGRTPLLVDPEGRVLVVDPNRGVIDLNGQPYLGTDFLDVLAPFEEEGIRGPDLIRPRDHLRIVPGKLSGEPHVEGTRLSTLTIAALADGGMDIEGIRVLYPDFPLVALEEAIDLEQELERNRLRGAAA